MGKALADMLRFAFGLLAAPFPIVALVTGGHASAAPDGASPTWVYWVRIVLGVVMVAFALRTLRTHLARDPDAPVAPPAWLAAIGRMGAGKVAGLAVLLAGVNPKGLAMLLGAGAAIGAYGLGGTGDTGAAVVFASKGIHGLLS